jgi:putative phosphoesterase
MEIGLISDTHGYINPRVFEVFSAVNHILHAGDIGSEDIITSLEAIAPVQAIHGNVDSFPMLSRYPAALALTLKRIVFCVIHIFRGVDDPLITDALRNIGKSRPDVIVFGHSHQAKLEWRDGACLFNPGSAGKRRFNLRPTVGLVSLNEDGSFDPRIVYLDE